MVRKSLNALNGVKVKTVFHERQHKPHKHHETGESQERIAKCLNCTKPARECKGDCWGRSN